MITLWDILKEDVIDYYDTENDSTEVYSAKSVLKQKVKDLVSSYNHSYSMRNRMIQNIDSTKNMISGTDTKCNIDFCTKVLPLSYGVCDEGIDYITFKIVDTDEELYLIAYSDIIRTLKDDLLKDTTVRDLPALLYIDAGNRLKGILEVKFKK